MTRLQEALGLIGLRNPVAEGASCLMKKRCSSPVEVTTSDNTAVMQVMVEENARGTVEQIAKPVGISSIPKILFVKLGFRKVYAIQVPHQHDEKKKVVRVNWCRTVVARFDGGRSDAVWEINSGDETWVYKSAVTVDWWAIHYLPKSLEAIAIPKPRARGALLHHDNAPAHRSHVFGEFLPRERVQKIGCPPYIPDVDSCDILCKRDGKRMMRGILYESPTAAVEAFTELI
ncbi:unnamed protein product [Echinostoma caproni]|uniref:DDE_3 domain-containing protein n=1 Tax=Echinostoma caproni TaxID=27848 RepID=A0A183ACJ9_9TREM|nr:unnamed protein product [Echinostoma caproni]